ncbi:TPA: hypothetical protein ACH3X1_004937 [Trebouxia sp. C0004]
MTGTQLIGKGKKLKHDAFRTTMQHVSQYLHRTGQSHWLETSSQAGPQPVQLCSYTLYTSVEKLMWSMAHKTSKSRVSFYAKLRFVSRHDTESLFIAEIQHFLRVINADAEVLRLAVCKLYPARYGRVEDVMTASLSSRTQQVLAVDISDTKLVTATEGTKLFGLVYSKMSGMA